MCNCPQRQPAGPGTTSPPKHTMATSRKLKLPIPVTLITGSLGVGKTTALCKLVAKKPPDEAWCIIVNEFGAVGIDAVALQSSAAAAAGEPVTVKQIAGGCMCCAQSGMLLPAIAQIIRQTKPDRLLIEPSGLGHPAGLLDILQGPHLGASLQLNAVICLVDLSTFKPEQLAQNPTAWDQVTVADILVGSKADACTSAVADAFQQWASEDLFPPKAQVLLASHGDLDTSCLNTPRSAAAASGLLLRTQHASNRARQQRSLQQGQQQSHMQATAVAQFAATQQTLRTPQSSAEAASSLQASNIGQQQGPTPTAAAPAQQPEPGKPLRMLGQALPTPTSSSSNSRLTEGVGEQQHGSCGWVFAELDVFDQGRLLQLLHAIGPTVARVKGVFRTGAKQWVMPAAASVGTGSVVGDGSADAAVAVGNCSMPLQLQEVCYRGPSLVEVILSDNNQAAAGLAAAAAVRACQQACARVQHVLSADPQPPGTDSHCVAAESMGDVWCQLEEALLACLVPTQGR